MKQFLIWLTVLATVSLWSDENIAIIKNLKGGVLIKHDGVYKKGEKGEYLQSGDLLQTSDNGRVGLVFNDGTMVVLGPKSLFSVTSYRFRPAAGEYDFDMTLSKGRAVVETGKMGRLAPEKVSFKVPQGSVGIRGTKFIVDIEE